MSYLLLVGLIGIIGGVAIGIQAPLASLLNQRLGVLESVFIIHIGGALVVGLPLLLMGGGKLGQWQQLPWYALAAGVLGVTVVVATVYLVPRIGVAGTVVLIIAGQFTMATVIDHFGAFGVVPQPISLQRLAGVVTMFTGVWLTVTAS